MSAGAEKARPCIAIIRAAGRGERMGEIAKYYQKCALPVDGRPLIVHWVSALLACGIDRHIIHLYRGDQVMGAVQTFEAEALRKGQGFTTSSMQRLPGIWEDTCRQIETLCFLQNRLIFLCYADNYSPHLTKIVLSMLSAARSLESLEIDAVIGVIPIDWCSKRTEKAVLGKSMTVLSDLLDSDLPLQIVYGVSEYRTGLVDANGWAWAGMGVFRPELFKDRLDNDTTTVLSFLASRGRLAAIRITDGFKDIQTF